MGIYTELIREKEENNIKLEQYADEALLKDRKMRRLESDIDDVQSALIYLLDKFGISVSRQYGHHSTESLLESILDPLDMMYYHAGSPVEEVKDRTEYILAFREDGKAVALTPSLRGYRWYSPHDNTTGSANREYLKRLRNDCYVLNKPLQEYDSVVLTFIVNVLHFLTVYDVIYLIMASASAALIGLALPYVNRWVYNVYLNDPAGQASRLKLFFALFMTLNIVRGAINLIKSKLLSGVKNRVSLKVQTSVMAKVLHLPRSFFTDNSSGKISKRIGNCTKLSDMIINIFLDILLDFSFSGVYLVQMRNFAPELFMPAILFVVLKIVVSIFGALGTAHVEKQSMAADMEHGSFFFSVIKGIQKIKGMGAEKAAYAKWAENYREILHYDYNRPFFVKYQGTLLGALATCTTFTLMGVAAMHDITRENYLIFTSSYAMILSVANSLTGIMNSIFRMRTLSDNIRPIFSYGDKTKEMKEYVQSLHGSIKVENVHFAYEGNQRGCVRGVSLELKPGEKIAFVGESGCGKSTLLKIILGMEKADEGTVYFDGKNIDQLNQKSLRQHIGSIFQFSKLFPGTIFANVSFGSAHEVSEEDVWHALDQACIGDYVRGLPLQLNTEITESNSCGFSGGQRQRLLIARALVGKPKVLIFDEATSALDNVTQKKVLDTVVELPSTVIMVAHRLSTVMNLDKIYMLEDGLIVESGTYDELMQQNGKFAELVRKQLVSEQEEQQKKKAVLQTA